VGGAKELTIIGQSKTLMVGSIVGKNDIANVRELKGKRLGIDRIGSNPDMYTIAALARFQMDPMRDLQYIQMGTTSQGIAGLKAGAVNASRPRRRTILIAPTRLQNDLGYHDFENPFAATVLLSTRNAVARKPRIWRNSAPTRRRSLLSNQFGGNGQNCRSIYEGGGPGGYRARGEAEGKAMEKPCKSILKESS
jgi:hypothetical protein